MSTLEALLDFPATWYDAWRVDKQGELCWVEPGERGKKAKKEGHGHGHKKDPKDMSKVELASIAGTCNAKTLGFILKKGSDAALINALGNPAMDAEKVIYMLTHRPVTAAVLGLVARSRFVKNRLVCGAICKNQKTPLHLSRGLVGRCLKSDLKDIIKAPGLSNALKMSARSKLDKKKH